MMSIDFSSCTYDELNKFVNKYEELIEASEWDCISRRNDLTDDFVFNNEKHLDMTEVLNYSGKNLSDDFIFFDILKKFAGPDDMLDPEYVSSFGFNRDFFARHLDLVDRSSLENNQYISDDDKKWILEKLDKDKDNNVILNKFNDEALFKKNIYNIFSEIQVIANVILWNNFNKDCIKQFEPVKVSFYDDYEVREHQVRAMICNGYFNAFICDNGNSVKTYYEITDKEKESFVFTNPEELSEYLNNDFNKALDNGAFCSWFEKKSLDENYVRIPKQYLKNEAKSDELSDYIIKTLNYDDMVNLLGGIQKAFKKNNVMKKEQSAVL